MACGVPVLATYVGGVVELVEPEQTGLVVPPADSLALSNALARYFDGIELRQKVARLGREMVERNYNLNAEIEKLARLFLAHVDGE
jgi:glycosyltransferase involved in cell wall biosynthesis